MIRRVLTIVAAATALVAAAAPVAGAISTPSQRAPKPRVAIVADDYFAPVSLKINKGARVKWNWSDDNFNSHNVTLSSGPKGVKRGQFKSSTGTIGIRFVRKFTVAGKYKFVCTLHRALMQMTVTVKKP